MQGKNGKLTIDEEVFFDSLEGLIQVAPLNSGIAVLTNPALRERCGWIVHQTAKTRREAGWSRVQGIFFFFFAVNFPVIYIYIYIYIYILAAVNV
jgi:hypothetical protein